MWDYVILVVDNAVDYLAILYLAILVVVNAVDYLAILVVVNTVDYLAILYLAILVVSNAMMEHGSIISEVNGFILAKMSCSKVVISVATAWLAKLWLQ